MSDQDMLPGSGEGLAPIAPAEIPPPVPEDLLGLRIGAALIDLVLLAGLFTILSAAVNPATVSGEGFNVSLSGLWLVVFLAAALGYYFVLEAWAGQTLGKRLLALRVLRADGTRPSVGAVALRTLLRVVDWLPLLYLVGFITMLATGTRRQRIGDLAARTALARALPVRHRGLALVPLIIVMLAAIALPVYRATSAGRAQTYRAHGVSFDYPAGWQEENLPATVASDWLWRTQFGPGTGADLVNVEAHRMWIPIAAGNLAAASSELEPIVRRFFAQEGGAMQAGPQQIAAGGLPGLRFQGAGTQQDGTSIDNTLLFIFNGTTEYAINCQHTQTNAGEVERACGQVMRTFKVTKAPATNGPEKMSATAVAHAAIGIFSLARSVRVQGTMIGGVPAEKFDLRYERTSISGSYVEKGSTYKYIAAGNRSYLKTSAAGWEAMGNTPDAADMLAGQWKQTGSAPSGEEWPSRAIFVSELGLRESAQGATVAQATLDGRRVVVVTYPDGSKLYVANTGPAYPVRFE